LLVEMLKISKNKKTEKKKVKTEKGKKYSRFLSIGMGKEREYFVENLSMLIASGMNIVAALKAIQKEMPGKQMKKILDIIQAEIEGGMPIWKALESAQIFPQHTISLIRVGEETGRLSENLKVVAIQEQKERIFRSKIQSAMMYPVLVLSLALFIGVGIAWFILPRLATVFSQLNVKLPLVTRALISTGEFLGDWGKIVIPGFLLLLILFFYLVFYFSKTKFIGQWFLFKLPGIKRLIQETEIARFGFLMGNLLGAGMPITSALNSLVNATTFRGYRNFYTHLKTKIDQGNSFQKSFRSYKKSNKFIPATIQHMIVSGEQSGALPQIFAKIGETYEVKTETTTKNLTVLLEPIMLIFVWLGVVAVALAVILPIYSLIGGLNQPKTINKKNISAPVKTENRPVESEKPVEETQNQESSQGRDFEESNQSI